MLAYLLSRMCGPMLRLSPITGSAQLRARPPGTSDASRTLTFKPASASQTAADSPAIPAPMMTTSGFIRQLRRGERFGKASAAPWTRV